MSETLPRVTVVIACREVGEVLEQSILSVLDQRYPSLDCIVVDGGSEDGTLDVLHKYEDRLAWWLSEPDNGPFDAMNKALAHLRENVSAAEQAGRWVCLLMGGDRLASADTLQQVFAQEELDFTKLRVIAGASLLTVSPHDATFETELAKSVATIPQQMPFRPSSVFFRLDEASFDADYRFAGDYALLYHLFYREGEKAFRVTDVPVSIPYQENPWRKYYKRYIRGEQLGIQSEHFSLHWLKTYFRWKWLWW